ncbi:MAG: hypothetical protein ACI4OJ_07605, partial [Lachnospiraceae bacterium]
MSDHVYRKEDCAQDPQFQEPFVDLDEWRGKSLRYEVLRGGFLGTKTRFCFYFPEDGAFSHRFFQRMMPVQGDETAAEKLLGTENDMITFAISHGAILIDTNMGGLVNGGGDETLVYRSSAACAMYARKLAAERFGGGAVYGYVFGGSGGGYKTISCLESTEGIWDGGVPFVIGSPMALPYVYTVRSHAMRLLRGKLEEIADALEPGGSGDPKALLTPPQKEALEEATSMGFPLKTWTVWKSLGEGALPLLAPAVFSIDPTYVTDFWTKEGYLGYEKEGSAARDRIHLETEITGMFLPDGSALDPEHQADGKNTWGVDEAWKNLMAGEEKLPVLRLQDFPEGDVYTKGLTLTFLGGALAKETIHVRPVGSKIVAVEPDPMESRDLAALLQKVRPHERVLLDNSAYLALQTYHRHQVPGPEYHAFDRFRKADGTPIYPQRPVLAGPVIARGGAGSVQSGSIHGRCIVVESLMDESAFPWQADWYRQQVKAHCGAPEEEQFRLYFMDHCMHTD